MNLKTFFGITFTYAKKSESTNPIKASITRAAVNNSHLLPKKNRDSTPEIDYSSSFSATFANPATPPVAPRFMENRAELDTMIKEQLSRLIQLIQTVLETFSSNLGEWWWPPLADCSIFGLVVHEQPIGWWPGHSGVFTSSVISAQNVNKVPNAEVGDLGLRSQIQCCER